MHRFLVVLLFASGIAEETCSGEGECQAPLAPLAPPAPPLFNSGKDSPTTPDAPTDLVVALQVARQKISETLKNNAIELEADSLSREGLDPFETLDDIGGNLGEAPDCRELNQHVCVGTPAMRLENRQKQQRSETR